MIAPVQVLVDADNLDVPRLRLFAEILAEVLEAALGASPSANVVVAGAAAILDAVDWPSRAQLHPVSGWQGADLLLASVYRPDDRPLLLATGDGDFVQLARRHPGPVLLVSGTSSRSRAFIGPRIIVTDPASDGGARLRSWLGQSTGM